MKKKIISWLMVMCIMALLVTALPITASVATSGTCGDNLTWTLDDAGTLTISGTGDMSGYYEAPWHGLINSIKNVIIENGVTSIGNFSFHECTNLTNITIPDSIIKIGDYAFCISGITSIQIPNSVTSIGKRAFNGCGIKSITIPNSVAYIGEEAFSWCTSINTVTIGKGTKKIDVGVFLGCRSLNDVYYGGSKSDWNKIVIGDNNESLTSATIHYASNTPYTTTTVSVKDGRKTFTISPKGIEIKDTIILTLYKNGVFVGLQSALYSGEDIIFESDTDCDSAKVLVWGSFANLKPVTNAETVNTND